MSIDLGFLIKKIISVGLMPLSLGSILALIALWFIYQNNIKAAKKYLSLSLLWIFLISYAPFADLLLAPLEDRYPRLEKIPPDVNYILLLGGDRQRRAWEALRLYQKIPEVKIITSGHSLHDKLSDAYKAAKLLEQAGVNKNHILMLEKAKDTLEEALYMKALAGTSPFILVTAAFHMPRSIQIFQQQGLTPIPAPADFNNTDESSIFSLLQGKQLRKTEKAWHEYIGLVFIKIKSLL